MGTDKNGSIIRIGLEIDARKASADAKVAATDIKRSVTTILGSSGGAGGGASPFKRQLADLNHLRSLYRAGVIDAKLYADSLRTAAMVSETGSRAQLAALERLRAVERRAASEREREQRAADRASFGGRFARGLASTRVNVGAASPLLSSATAGGVAGAAGAGFAVAGALVTQKVAQGLSDAVNNSIKFDAAFTEVRKFVTGSSAELEKLRKELLDLSKDATVGTDFVDLSHIAAFGAQLGVAREDLAEFTRQVAYLGKAGDVSGEEAATGLAKIAAAMNLSADSFPKLASSLTAMGNLGSSTMAEILDTAKRFASEASNLKLNPSEIFAYANAVTALGQEAEAGGSALTTVFAKIDRAVRDGGKELETYAKISGVTSAQFAKNFREKPAQAVAQFLAGLDKVSAKAGAVGGVLDSLGIKNVRQVQAVQNLAKGHDLLSKALDASAKAWNGENEAQKKAETQATSLKEKIALLHRTIKTDGAQAAENLKPLIGEIIDLGTNGVKAIEDLTARMDLLGSKQFGPLVDWLKQLNAEIKSVSAANAPGSAGAAAARKPLQAALDELNATGRISQTTGSKADQVLFSRFPQKVSSGFQLAQIQPSEARGMLSELILQLMKEEKTSRKAWSPPPGPDYTDAMRGKTSPNRGGPGNAPAPPDASSAEIKRLRLGGELRRRQDDLSDAQQALKDAWTAEQVGKARKWVESAAKKIQETQVRIAATERAIDAEKKGADPKVLDEVKRQAVEEARRTKERTIQAAARDAKDRKLALAKEAEQRAKERKREKDSEAEKAAAASKEAGVDSLEVQVNQAERTVSQAKESFKQALETMKGALTSEELNAAVLKAAEVSTQIRQTEETLAKLKKALVNKNAGKETDASLDELAGQLGNDGFRKLLADRIADPKENPKTKERLQAFMDRYKDPKQGTLSLDLIARSIEISDGFAAGTQNVEDAQAKNAESEARGKRAITELSGKVDDAIEGMLQENRDSYLQSLESQLAAIPVKGKNVKKIGALLAKIAETREALIDGIKDKVIRDSKQFRDELSERMATEKDPNIKKAIRQAIEDYDTQTATFDVVDENGKKVGTKTITGGLAIQEYIAGQEAQRAKNNAKKDTATYVSDANEKLRKSNPKLAAAGALSTAVGAGFDSLVSGGKGAGAASASLRSSLESGVKDEIGRGISNMATLFFQDTSLLTKQQLKAVNEQKKAAIGQLKAAAALAGAASALSALSGQQGGKKQGQAVLGALAGYYASTRTGAKNDGATLAELGVNLATGNFLGAGLSLLGGKIKFASGGRTRGRSPIVVGDGGRPEIFVPESAGYILPDARAAMVQMWRSAGVAMDGDRPVGRARYAPGNTVTISPTFHHHGNIYERSDAEYILQREQQDLADLAFKLGVVG